MNYSEFTTKISEKLISIMESGKLSWRESWSKSLPMNFVSKRRYNGMNLFSLFSAMIDENFTNPGFLTFLQASKKGLKITAGSKGKEIIFWKADKVTRFNETTNELKTDDRLIAKIYYVFNIAQTDYVGEVEIPKPEEPQSLLDAIVLEKNIVTTFHPTKAAYNPDAHTVLMPDMKQFTTPEEYYATFFHELIHWTIKDLKRETNTDHKSTAYAHEELIAEFGSSFLCALCGIENTLDNSAAYIQGWIKAGKLDKNFIPSAITAASKATEFLTKEFFAVQELKEAA